MSDDFVKRVAAEVLKIQMENMHKAVQETEWPDLLYQMFAEFYHAEPDPKWRRLYRLDPSWRKRRC